MAGALSPLSQPKPFRAIPRLQSSGKDTLVEFTVVPKQETRSKLIELMVADPLEGLHLIKENDNAVYYKDTSLIEEDDC